jgi:glyoxylase-like metal-dependent hydrolase (beta-lactamase superfamily II)
MERNPLEWTRFITGPLETNAYVLADPETRVAAVIDPGGSNAAILRFLESRRLIPEKILLTHGHFDHIAGVPELKLKTGAEVWVHPDDAAMVTDGRKNLSVFIGPPVGLDPADALFFDGMELPLGTLRLRVLHTPGHSPGSVSFTAEGLAFVGDVLFRHSVGRTDFPGSSMETLLHSIWNVLLPLGDSTEVLPGHGESTTLGHERTHNPFLGTGDRGI